MIDNNKYCQRYGETETLLHYWWGYIIMGPLWKTDWQSNQNVQHSGTILPRNCTPRYLPKRKKTYPYENFYVSVHINIIHNRQKVGKKTMPINKWMDKQYVVYPYNRILFGNRKECGADNTLHR